MDQTTKLLCELTDWAREHTSPHEPNSPHDILVRIMAHLATLGIAPGADGNLT